MSSSKNQGVSFRARQRSQFFTFVNSRPVVGGVLTAPTLPHSARPRPGVNRARGREAPQLAGPRRPWCYDLLGEAARLRLHRDHHRGRDRGGRRLPAPAVLQLDREDRREDAAGPPPRAQPAGGRRGHAHLGPGSGHRLPGREGPEPAGQGHRRGAPGLPAEVPVPGERLRLRARHRGAQPHDHRRRALLIGRRLPARRRPATRQKPRGACVTLIGMSEEPREKPTNFIRDIILEHNARGRFGGRVITRFPPEPNGYLPIGHAQATSIGCGMAAEFGRRCHLRFDDTNPAEDSQEYVDSIIETVRWLGFDWGKHLYYASDYFEQLYQWAEQLIVAGQAYVDDLTPEQMSEYRGTLTEPGRESPYRNRSFEEELDLFRRMRAGEFEDGAKTLRAKIDMTSGNINLRDPVMYRIRKATHHRTGDAWCIYPMYDWAHGQSDSIEGITHSICTLEYEDHRPLYDWYLDQLGVHHPQQIEFARLNLSHTIMSKRKLLELVQQQLVSGWDDPRMPTLAGLRRRGY